MYILSLIIFSFATTPINGPIETTPSISKKPRKTKPRNNKIILDKQTARRLFTLICVMHFKG